jgi:hypothetical protein
MPEPATWREWALAFGGALLFGVWVAGLYLLLLAISVGTGAIP